MQSDALHLLLSRNAAGDKCMKKAYLVLANGKVFEGKRFGADTAVTGELVFTTGVVGYLENLTDPN